jgi:hypothetical protein
MAPEPTDALAALSPVTLKAFLENQQWHFSSSPRSSVELWRRNGHEIIVPLNMQAPDYSKRIRNFVEDLASERGRSKEDVARELAYIDDDVIDFKVADTDDSIPLSEAAKILEAAKALTVASACSAINRRPYHGNRRPRKAREFANAVRMGHTRRGSFIIPIISPVRNDFTNVLDEQIQTMDLAGEAEFFPRRVTGMMADTLKLLYDFAVVSERQPSEYALNRAVVDGLSADTCAAVAQMLTSSRNSTVDVSFQWAIASPPPRAGAENLEFPVEAVGAINEIEETLLSGAELDDTVIYGFVSSLERDAGEPRGTVKVRTIVKGRARPVSVTLDEDAYHVATEAHDLRMRVVAAGPLITRSNGALAMQVVDSFRTDDYLPFRITDEWANEQGSSSPSPDD